MANVVYKATETNIKDMMVYSIDPDCITTGRAVVAPFAIFLKNQGIPREKRIFIVLAPREFDTPNAPSPATFLNCLKYHKQEVEHFEVVVVKI